MISSFLTVQLSLFCSKRSPPNVDEDDDAGDSKTFSDTEVIFEKAANEKEANVGLPDVKNVLLQDLKLL